jgi:hypothetical protein
MWRGVMLRRRRHAPLVGSADLHRDFGDNHLRLTRHADVLAGASIPSCRGAGSSVRRFAGMGDQR